MDVVEEYFLFIFYFLTGEYCLYFLREYATGEKTNGK